MTTTPTRHPSADQAALEARIHAVGEVLGRTLTRVTDAIAGVAQGPQNLARALGVDKVLASRLLKTVRQRDAMAVLHHAPGPEPLRRFLRGARRNGAPNDVVRAAEAAVDDFERLIQRDVGDRSALGTIISAWLPEARAEFELRRKQSAFKALSELKGSSAALELSAGFLHPSSNGTHLDVVWVIGLLGLRRLRPGVGVKVSTRRSVLDGADRRPTTLAGHPIETLEHGRLDDFCDAPPGELVAHRVEGAVHYALGGEQYGPSSDVDVLVAEVNLTEMPRFVAPEKNRRGYLSCDVVVPAKKLVFDAFVHRDVYPGEEPELRLYDTAIYGAADINDPTRDMDRLDLAESIQPLGYGLGNLRVAEMPKYVELIRHVHERMGWNPDDFRGYRCRIEYPIYGSQAAMAFRPPAPPDQSSSSSSSPA